MAIILGIGLVIIIWCCIWGAVCQSLASQKNIEYGFLLGFFLGFIGLIIILCMKDNSQISTNSVNDCETLEKLLQLKEKGIITENEFEEKKQKILNKI